MKQDQESGKFSDYERRRAEMHHLVCRLVSTLQFAAAGTCRLRECRRVRACNGPMETSPLQEGVMRAQREIGLTGRACAELPLCISRAGKADYEIYREAMRRAEMELGEFTLGEMLFIYRRAAALRRPARKVS